MHDKKVLHRDVKPANVLINDKGEVKLCDFGMSRFAMREDKYETLLGTLGFIAPEILEIHRQKIPKGLKCYSKKIDIYSLGAMAYELATEHVPYSEDKDILAPLYHDPEPIK